MADSVGRCLVGASGLCRALLVGVGVSEMPVYAVELHLEEFELASLINLLEDLRELPRHRRELLAKVVGQLDDELGLLM